MQDKLILGGHEFTSRFILGSGKYNLNLINAAVEEGGAEIITLEMCIRDSPYMFSFINVKIEKIYSSFRPKKRHLIYSIYKFHLGK